MALLIFWPALASGTNVGSYLCVWHLFAGDLRFGQRDLSERRGGRKPIASATVGETVLT